ncbi:hypothetical protein cyc_08703 [Cyclospora cayetanensis]|uniref:Uncharacterized protein n=1 Tax=Cyclospora cayetanensis TaxID=88456 RepID=A0A1D3D292_9EIME|nr:hypothetical protein cyc_08703 [Cyclospora cayetanensis]
MVLSRGLRWPLPAIPRLWALLLRDRRGVSPAAVAASVSSIHTPIHRVTRGFNCAKKLRGEYHGQKHCTMLGGQRRALAAQGHSQAGDARPFPSNEEPQQGASHGAVEAARKEAPACKAAPPSKAASTSEEEAAAEARRQRLAEQAAQSQRLWDLLVPDKNMSLFSPAFWVLLVAVLCLHAYNNEREKQQAQLGDVLTAEETKQRMLAEGARMRRQHQYNLQQQQEQRP